MGDTASGTSSGREFAPGERPLHEDLESSGARFKPLSRRARQRPRSLESYLAAAVMPRHIERLRQIEDELAFHAFRLEREYRRLWRLHRGDTSLFARRWRATAEHWRFDDVNELIRQHNEYYPIEARLPLDPRTGDYVQMRGRSYRREPIGAAWVLARFPA